MPTDLLRTERYFERRAHQFDALYAEERRWQYFLNRLLRRPLYERVHYTVEAFHGLRDFTVLDVGCGSGRNSVVFAKSGARRVVGIDFTPKMIALADRCARRHDVESRCEFILGDVMDYPFTEKFDAVVALGVHDYVRDPVPLLRRMKELSTERVVASFPGWSAVRAPLRKARYWLRDCPVYFSTRDRLETLCDEAGLEDRELRPLSGRAGWVLVGRVAQPAARAAHAD